MGIVRQKSIFPIICAVLALCFGLFFYKAFNHPVVTDARQYKILSENVLYHGVYSLSEEPPYAPTALREPMYPAFIAGLLKVSGGKYAAVHIAQIILFILTVLMIYGLGLKIFGEGVARWAALLTALCPTLANYPSYLLSETLFGFLITLYAVVTLRAVESNKIGWYICSGAVAALASLTKSVAFLLFVPTVFAAFLYVGGLGSFIRKYLKNFVVFGLVFLVLVSGWIVRNHNTFGRFSLSMRSGLALWIRSVKLDYDMEAMKREAVFSFSEYLGAKLYPDVERPDQFLVKEAMAGYEKIRILTEQGYNEAEIDHKLLEEALPVIKKAPLKYAAQSLLEGLKMTAFLYIPILNEPHITEEFQRTEKGRLLISAARGIFRALAYLVLLLTLLGFFGERKKWRQWIFIAAIIVYINLSYSLLFGWGRYNVPLIPLYIMFAVAGFAFIKKKLCGKGFIHE